jgi:hypothetical protein
VRVVPLWDVHGYFERYELRYLPGGAILGGYRHRVVNKLHELRREHIFWEWSGQLPELPVGVLLSPRGEYVHQRLCCRDV